MATFNLMSTFVVLVVAVKCNTPSSVESEYSDEDKDFPILETVDGWSEWSPCSRSCDGGTSFQIRKCNQCSGPSMRYRICNMQVCPDSVEFRDQQCAVYNEVPYDGKLLSWVGYSGPETPHCELWCQSDNGVITKMAPSVQDGTRCRPGSLDLCVEGRCQKVGCDLVIGSEAKVDICGICGGDSSTCAQPLYHWVVQSASLCSATCGSGTKMSQVICKNSVTGLEVENELCDASQKPASHIIECNTHPCPAKWVAEAWSQCSATCSSGVRSRTVTCMKMINSTLTKVVDSTCKTPKLRTSEACISPPCVPTWTTKSWTMCSASCGEGVEWREVTCSDLQMGCDVANKPDGYRPCNSGIACPSHETSGPMQEIDDTMIRMLHPYPPPFQPIAERLVGEPILSSFSSSEPNFKAESWSECSVSCGDGVRSREVSCTIFLEFSRTYAKLPDSHCQGTKPPDTEPCSQPPCPLRVETIRDGFSEPSSYPDTYKRMPYNEPGIRVAPHQSGKTYAWKMQGYTHCSASCLGGVQESIIMCVQEDDEKVVGPYLCSTNTRPETLTRTCNDHPCPPRWNHTDFQSCSKPCGMGIQTREVYCIHEVTRGGSNTVIVPDHMCPHPPPPDRQYCNVLDCPVNWHSSEWSKCSKRCGGGLKTRSVECKQIMAQNHVLSRPGSQCPKNKPPDRRPCNTKPCPTEEQRPPIISTNQSYVQSNPTKRKVSLKIGGSAQVFHGSQVKIKCPVKKFDRSKIQWAKDHKLISSSKKYRISKKGALRIQEATYGDTGVFTCLAGRSSADITITVKVRPGEFPSSEEIEKHIGNQLDPAMHSNGDTPHRPFILSGDDESHEQHPGESASPRKKSRPQTAPPPTTQHQQQTTGNEKWLVVVGSTDGPEMGPTYMWPDLMPPPTPSSATRPIPHIQQLISNIQRLSGMQPAKEQPVMDEPLALGKAPAEPTDLEWILSDWSSCSVTCGDNGYQIRTAHCMLMANNSSKNADISVCLDAGFIQPVTKQKCSSVACPRWVPSNWQPCSESRCFTYNTAMQRRNVECQTSNGTILEDKFCDDILKPIHRQECFYDKCKGTWRVGDWSECAAGCDSQGVKYRILQCVWFGTKKPAGNACRDLPRPSVMKMCRGPACSDKSQCLDHSKYCQNIRAMNMCRMYRYQTQCCQSCSDSDNQ